MKLCCLAATLCLCAAAAAAEEPPPWTLPEAEVCQPVGGLRGSWVAEDAPPVPPHFEPFVALIGKDWRGAFPDGGLYDTKTWRPSEIELVK